MKTITYIDSDGTKLCLIEYANGPNGTAEGGTKAWYQNDQRHRLDGPAIEDANGNKWWYQNGQCHRLDGPSIEYANGDKAWYQNGQLHRLDGPAIEYANGRKAWYQNGQPTTPEILATYWLERGICAYVDESNNLVVKKEK